MKKIIFILSLIVSIAHAQSDTVRYNRSANYGEIFRRVKAWNLLLPTDTTNFKHGFAGIGTTAYIGNGSKWTAISGGSSVVDSLIYATWRRLYKVVDSVNLKYSENIGNTNLRLTGDRSLSGWDLYTFKFDSTRGFKIASILGDLFDIQSSGQLTIQTSNAAENDVPTRVTISGQEDTATFTFTERTKIKAEKVNPNNGSAYKILVRNNSSNDVEYVDAVNVDTTNRTTGIRSNARAIGDSLVLSAAINAKPNFGDIRDHIRDSLNAFNRLRAGTSAGGVFQTNTGATSFSYGAGGSTEVTFNGFAGYNANRASSYTSRSFVTKNDLDSTAATKQDVKLISKGLIIGNSTIASYLCGTQVGAFLFTPADTLQGNTYYNQAVPGDSIVGQMNIFLADPNRATYDWVIVEIGLNDLQPAISAATTLVKYQKLIDTLRAVGKPNMKIIVSSMILCRQRLIDVYGAINGPISYAKELAMNYAIMGGGANKILGANYRINEHVQLLSDSAGNLLSVYDCGDKIHQNNAGRMVIASVWRRALNELGFLNIQQPTVFNPSTIGGSANNYYFNTTEAAFFTGSTASTSVNINNSSNTGQGFYSLRNNANRRGLLSINGSLFPRLGTAWANNTVLGAENNIIINSGAYSSTGSVDSIRFTSGGLLNAPTVTITNGKLIVAGTAEFSNNVTIESVTSLTSNTVRNTSTTGQAAWFSVNNSSLRGGVNTFGSAFARAGSSLANNTLFFADRNLILQTGANVLSGGIDTINMTIGGLSNLPSFLLHTGNIDLFTNLNLKTAGNKINIATGSNASIGSGTFSSGTATISTTAVTANSRIFIQYTSCTSCGSTYISAKTAGTSFVVTSTNGSDTSTFDWWIIN
jgi:hypothetical protein